MFLDLAQIKLQAGQGGNGLVSFRREKYVDRGGPNGGNGGHGGSIFFQASPDVYDLGKFRFKKLIKAPNGGAGGSSNKTGKAGEDITISVPVGTIIYDAQTQTQLADLSEAGQIVLVAHGGLGGFGNAHFKSSTNRAPLVAEIGLKGQVKIIRCELKLLAEVGLVGLPNSGKSTFLKVTTNANPKIGSYAFTTLEPHLGVSFNQCLIADIPGLIAGASEGKGLGHQFLRHIERNLVLLHLIDIQADKIDQAYLQILTELEKYNPKLLDLPQLVALTKLDLVKPQFVDRQLKALKPVLKPKHVVYTISALSSLNIDQLLGDLKQTISQQRNLVALSRPTEAMVVFKHDDKSDFTVLKVKNKFMVRGVKIETFAAKLDLSNFHNRQRIRDIMHKMGVTSQLISLGYVDELIVFGKSRLGQLYLYERGED